MFGVDSDDRYDSDIDRESDAWLELRHQAAMDSSMFADSDDLDRQADEAYMERE